MKSITATGFVIGVCLVLAGLVLAPFISRNSVALAEEGDPEKGLALALERCGGCHAVTPGTESPVAEAPKFETLGQRWPVEYLEEALAEGIMVGHEDYQMPVFQFTTEEIADLIAYLKSIQTGPQATMPDAG